MNLTLLSPDTEQLRRLKPDWEKEVRKAGLDPDRPEPYEAEELPDNIERFGAGDPQVDDLADTPFEDDSSPANGSSIAVMA